MLGYATVCIKSEKEKGEKELVINVRVLELFVKKIAAGSSIRSRKKIIEEWAKTSQTKAKKEESDSTESTFANLRRKNVEKGVKPLLFKSKTKTKTKMQNEDEDKVEGRGSRNT